MFDDDDYPCNTCGRADWCDGWDANYCCELCYYFDDDPDCDDCDPWDI